MFYLALVCIVIALIAYFLGAQQVTDVAIKGAKILFVIGIIILVLSLVLGWGVPWSWTPTVPRY